MSLTLRRFAAPLALAAILFALAPLPAAATPAAAPGQPSAWAQLWDLLWSWLTPGLPGLQPTPSLGEKGSPCADPDGQPINCQQATFPEVGPKPGKGPGREGSAVGRDHAAPAAPGFASPQVHSGPADGR